MVKAIVFSSRSTKANWKEVFKQLLTVSQTHGSYVIMKYDVAIGNICFYSNDKLIVSAVPRVASQHLWITESRKWWYLSFLFKDSPAALHKIHQSVWSYLWCSVGWQKHSLLQVYHSKCITVNSDAVFLLIADQAFGFGKLFMRACRKYQNRQRLFCLFMLITRIY